MSNHQPNVGPLVRGLRERRSLLMRGLAEWCEWSPNPISLIERGVTSPNVSSLHQHASALRVHITESSRTPERTRLVLSRARDRLVSVHEQALLECQGSGLAEQLMEPFKVALVPGAGIGHRVMSHGGQELL